MNSLKGSTVPISKLKPKDRSQLLDLFVTYYDDVCSDTFFRDLSDKDKIILLREKNTDVIKGFSTIKKLCVEYDNKKIYALFSGDTIVDSDFWGQSALSIQFVKNLILFKMGNPTSRLYWFLICKGFKTYLVLTKNFEVFYPRHDEVTPKEINSLIDEFAMRIYPAEYNKMSKVIELSGKSYKLKDNVAPIGERERENEHIHFFDQSNPGWVDGDELCCVGLFNLKAIKCYLGVRVKKLRSLYK